MKVIHFIICIFSEKVYQKCIHCTKQDVYLAVGPSIRGHYLANHPEQMVHDCMYCGRLHNTEVALHEHWRRSCTPRKVYLKDGVEAYLEEFGKLSLNAIEKLAGLGFDMDKVWGLVSLAESKDSSLTKIMEERLGTAKMRLSKDDILPRTMTRKRNVRDDPAPVDEPALPPKKKAKAAEEYKNIRNCPAKKFNEVSN